MLLVFKVFSYINAGRIKVLWATFKQENKSLETKEIPYLTLVFLQQHTQFIEAKGRQFYCLLLFSLPQHLTYFLKIKIFHI